MQDVEKISGTFYTIDGAAKELGKHRTTISRWIKEGRLPVIRLAHVALTPEEAILRCNGFEPKVSVESKV